MFKREDVLVGIFSVLLGIFAIIVASTFNQNTAMDAAGPSGVPKVLAWVILVIGVIHIVGGYLTPKTEGDIKAKLAKEFEDSKVILRITLVCILYIFFLEYIGYLIATPLLIMGIMRVIDVKSIKSLLSTAIITTIALFVIFQIVLGVNFPMGFLGEIF